MKKLIVTTLFIFCASLVLGQVVAQPRLGVYFDEGGTQRTSTISPCQPFSFYIIAYDAGDVQGYDFEVVIPTDLTVLSRVTNPPEAIDWYDTEPDNWYVSSPVCLPAAGPLVLVEYRCILLDDVTDYVIWLRPSNPTHYDPPSPGYVTCGLEILPFMCWELGGGGEGIINPVTLVPSICSSSGIEVTVATSTPGLEVVVDGVSYVAPTEFLWEPGSSHEIGVNSPQSLGWTDYEFSSWSDGGDMTHMIVVPDGGATYTAAFTPTSVLHQVTIATSPWGLEVVVDGLSYLAPTEFLWEPGSSHEIGVNSPQNLGVVEYEFSSWSDGGDMTHMLVVPDDDVVYKASFIAAGPTPEPRLGVYFDEGGTQRTSTISPCQPFSFYIIAYDAGDVQGYDFEVVIPTDLTVLSRVTNPPEAIDWYDTEPDNWYVSSPVCLPAAGPLVLVEYRCILLDDVTDYVIWLRPSNPTHYDPPSPGYVTCGLEILPFMCWELGGGGEGIINPVTLVPSNCMGGDCEQPILSLIGYETISWNDPLWEVKVGVHNTGPGEARDVVVTMNEDIPWLVIPDPRCSYGTIPEGSDSWDDGDSYTFDLTDHPGGSFNVWFDVSYQDACGNQYTLWLDPEFEPHAGGETPDAVDTYLLSQNYPNPFNPNTRISFQLPLSGHVNLQIFDVSGKLVRTLIDGQKEQGHHAIDWDGKDNNGVTAISGVYFYKIQAGDFIETKKMVLLK